MSAQQIRLALQSFSRWMSFTLFLGLAIVVAPAMSATPDLSFYSLCLTDGAAKPIRLELRVFSESSSRWTSAYVRYRGGKSVIPLVLASTESVETAPGRPWEFTAVWLEVVSGKISGQYEVATQGALVNRFVYKNMRNGKETAFKQDSAAATEKGCE